MRAWLRNAEPGDNVEIIILDKYKKEYRFKLVKAKGARVKPKHKAIKKEYYTGEPINYADIKYAPRNEAGVIILWTRMLDELGMDYVTSLSSQYIKGGPDAVAKMPEGRGWVDKFIEFEYKSRNAKGKHDFKYIDYIVCWEHNWKDCPVEVIELKSIIFGEPEEE